MIRRIIGCARSGTLYTTKLLQQCGLDIGHEYTLPDGTVSAFCLGEPPYPDTPWEPPLGQLMHKGEDCTKIPWDITLHQVRHPLKTIASCKVVLISGAWEYCNRVCPDIPVKRGNKLHKCMIYWYYWNLECEKLSKFTYQLEQMPERWDEISEALGLDCEMPTNIPMNTNHNKRSKIPFADKNFTIEDVGVLYDIDPMLTTKIVELANRYGYEL